MKIALLVLAFSTLVFSADRLALWAERRGWIYWRRTKGRGGAGAGMLLDLDAVFNPGAAHVLEAREAEPGEVVHDDDLVRPPLESPFTRR